MMCPNCYTLNPDGQTVCADCGRPLPVSRVEPHPIREIPWGCTCGGSDVCVACVLASFERHPA